MMRSLSVLLFACLFAAPAAAQERQWNFDQTDKDAYLVFGVADTDDVGLSFWCSQRSGWVTLFVPETDPKLKTGRKVRVDIHAAGKRYRYQGAATANEDSRNVSVEVRLQPNDKLFTALRNDDRLRIVVGKSEHIYPLQDIDFEPLLQLCSKG